jgi:hypothetical protein
MRSPDATLQLETAPDRSARPDSQITGNVGLYYCCYRLSLLGWNVMPTARNARGVDIIAYTRGITPRFIGVQVKTLSKRNPVPLGTSLNKCMGDFWIIVTKVATAPTAFLLLPGEVTAGAREMTKDGRVSYWLQPAAYEHVEFREAWHRLGLSET